MKNRDWLITFNRNIDQNQSRAYIGQSCSQGSFLPAGVGRVGEKPGNEVEELAYTLHINSLAKGGSSLTKSFFLLLEVHQFCK